MIKFPKEFEDIVEGIRSMRIRGAAKIAREAVSALKIAASNYDGVDATGFISYIKEAAKRLVNTRPTAVSLPNGIRYVLNKLLNDYESGVNDVDTLKSRLEIYSNEFIEISIEAAKKIAIFGARRIEDGDVILTHCNSSVAIGVIKRAFDEGKSIKVYVTETRPRYQGRLTAEALSDHGIKTIMIVDSAVRYFMNDVDKVIVGADAIAANGAVVNKIGTSLIALAAHEARTSFMVAAETYKFSPDTLFGKLIKIEERGYEEVVPNSWLSKHPNIIVRNPAFDVTPPDYIDLIITELGVVSPSMFPLLIMERYGAIYSELEPWE